MENKCLSINLMSTQPLSVQLIRFDKFLSYLLRHKPEEIDLTIDVNGWANVDELIDKINNNSKFNITMEILEHIVINSNKQRYSFNEDKTKIRANQDHSINVDIELSEKVPPNILYHGTGIKYIKFIKKQGLISKTRNHVHLSENYNTALEVGKRHGTPYYN